MGMRERISMLTPAYKEAAMRSLALLALSLIATAAFAQPSVRVRGAISAFDGKTLAVKDAGGKSFDIRLVDKTEIVFAQPVALGEIEPGCGQAAEVAALLPAMRPNTAPLVRPLPPG